MFCALSSQATFANRFTSIRNGSFFQTQNNTRRVTVKGTVYDKETNETMIGVSIRVAGTDITTITDMDGNFVLSLPEGNYKLTLTYIGYDKVECEFDTNKPDKLKRIEMSTGTTKIQEVVVTGIYQRKKESFTGSAAIPASRISETYS